MDQAKKLEASATTRDKRDAIAPRASNMRREAVQLLAEAESTGKLGEQGPAKNAAGAALAVDLADACMELGEWRTAELALLRAIPHLEDSLGISNRRVVALWAKVASLKMKQGNNAGAETDLEHVLKMQSVLHGKGAGARVILFQMKSVLHTFTLCKRERGPATTVLGTHGMSGLPFDTLRKSPTKKACTHAQAS